MQPEEQKYFYSFWAARTLDEGLLAVRNGCFLHKWQWGPTQFSLPIFISSQNTVSDQHSIRHPSHWLESEKSSTSPNEAASFTFIYWNKVSCLHVHRAISSFGGWPTPRVFLTELHALSCSTRIHWEHQCLSGWQTSPWNPMFAYRELAHHLRNTGLNLTMMNLMLSFHTYSFLFGVSDTNTKLQFLLEQFPREVFTESKSKATLAINGSFVLPFSVLRKCRKSSLCASL